MHQFVQQAGFPALTYDQQAWIDGRAGPGAHAALAGAGLEGVQRELAVFNRSLGSPYAPRTFEPGSADVGTGLLAADAPRWLVQSEGFQPVGVDADVVASSTYLPTRVLLRRLRSPGRLVYRVLSPGPFKVRVYGTGCMRISFQAPPGSAGSHPWRLVSPAGTARGILHGETSATVQRPLSGGTYEDFVLFAKGGANVSEIARTPC
jgi:hypothetical protein